MLVVRPVHAGAQKTLHIGLRPGSVPSAHPWLLDKQLNDAQETFVLYVEINRPGDDAPSLIYAANIDPEARNHYTLLNLIAHSGGSEKDGELNYDLTRIEKHTTPVERILVKTTWGK